MAEAMIDTNAFMHMGNKWTMQRSKSKPSASCLVSGFHGVSIIKCRKGGAYANQNKNKNERRSLFSFFPPLTFLYFTSQTDRFFATSPISISQGRPRTLYLRQPASIASEQRVQQQSINLRGSPYFTTNTTTNVQARNREPAHQG